MNKYKKPSMVQSAVIALITTGANLALAQSVPQPTPAPAVTAEAEEDIIELSPFTVSADDSRGYQATSTLAGTQIRTDLSDVGSAISVITKEFLTDVGGYNNQTVLAYAVNTEVAGPRGNFSGASKNGAEGHITESANFNNPNANTRVRGLTSADNTRDYFLSDIPWDGYNISRVDLLRGPNAILFGLGSPAGIINAGTNGANFRNSGNVDVMFDEFGTQRASIDFNRVLLKKELAVRVDLLDNNQKFQQKPAFRHDQRGFVAGKYAPAFLNKNGTRFEVTANAEYGKIKSNNPRSIPPEDQISNFWKPLAQGGINKRTFNVFTDYSNADSNYSDPHNIYKNYDNLIYGQFGPEMMLYANAGSVPAYSDYLVHTYGARDVQGNVINSTSAPNPGSSWGNQLSDTFVMRTTQQWAASPSGNLPYAGVGAYRNDYLTDTSVFDFYHQLLDGKNKEEFNRWRAGTIDIQNTFFNDSIGYDLTMYRESVDSGAWSALGWEGNAIKLDINDKLPSGGDNPNVGKAYISARTGGGAWSNKVDREAYRAKVFGNYNFSKKHSGAWAKVLGSHSVTGVYSNESSKSDFRSYRLFDLDSSYHQKVALNPRQNGNDVVNGLAAFKYYISPDLRSRAGASGANVSNLATPFIDWNGGTTQYQYFDNTWTANSSVNAGAAWVNPLDPTNLYRGSYFQSNNPANYKGWTTATAQLLTYKSSAIAPGTSVTARDYLTDSATLTDSNVRSEVGVWQGTFWNKSIIGIYGMRRDRARSYNYNTSFYNRLKNVDPLTGSADVRASTYNYNNPDGDRGYITTRTKNYSVMAHVNKLVPGFDPLPFNLRVYFNKGENFQPAAGRNDMLGRPLPPPGGSTTDKSIMISTKDDRFSLRLTKYKTSITNATSTDAEIGNLWALQQTLGFGGDTNYFASPPGIARGYLKGLIDYQGYGDSGGDINKLKNSILPAWFKFEKDLRAKFPEYVEAWFGPNNSFGTDNLDKVPNANRPAGSVFTEDSVSSGYEVEFTANPTKNWRIAINASQTQAVRSNVPGKSFADVASYIDNAFQTTDAGLTPMWWPQNVAGLRALGPYAFFFRPEWLKVQALNGQSAGEIRKYRGSVVTNYDFSEGRLKGFGIGGGYRYEDKSIIGYAPIKDTDGAFKVNIKAPFYAPADHTVDAWLSYSRKLSHGIQWRIQLNVFNVGGKNKLVPITAGVDAAAALAQGLTNDNVTATTKVPMKATGFSIKEGMTWQISNHFEF